MLVVGLEELHKACEGIPAAGLLHAYLAHCIFDEFFCIDELALYGNNPEHQDYDDRNNDYSY